MSETRDVPLPANQQTPELEKLRELTDNMRHQSNPISDTWRQFYESNIDYVFDNQLDQKHRGKGHQRIQMNKLYPSYAQQIAVQLNRKTTMVAEPVEIGDASAADVWGSYLQWYYEKALKFDERVRTAATLDGHITGIYVAKPYWDPKCYWDEKARKWVGQVKMNIINPSYFGMDPEAKDYVDYSDCEYVLMEHRVSVKKAIQMFPKHRKEIEDQAGYHQSLMNAGDRETFGYGSNERDARPIGGYSNREGSYARHIRNHGQESARYDENGPEYVTITEFIFKDRSEIVDPKADLIPSSEWPEGSFEEDDISKKVVDPKFFKKNGLPKAKKGDILMAGNWPRKQDKIPEFPYGRKVIRVDDIILNTKREDQRYPYKRWELILGINLPLPHNARGLDSIQMAKGLQDWLNVGASSLASYLMLMGSPITLVEEGAIANDPKSKKASKLRRVSGAIWRMTRGAIARNAVKTLDPPQIPQSALAIMQMVSDNIQDLSGSENISLGKTSAGEQTGTEVAILAENAAQRQSLPGKLMDAWTLRVFEHISDLLMKHHEPGDVVRIVGEQHEKKLTELKESYFDLRFDLKMHVVDAMPFSKMARKQEAKETFEILANSVGVSTVALSNLLDVYDAPNKEEIIKEVESIQQSQTEAAQREAAAGQALAQQELDIKARDVAAKEEATRAQERQSAREKEVKQAKETGRTYTRTGKDRGSE